MIEDPCGYEIWSTEGFPGYFKHMKTQDNITASKLHNPRGCCNIYLQKVIWALNEKDYKNNLLYVERKTNFLSM